MDKNSELESCLDDMSAIQDPTFKENMYLTDQILQKKRQISSLIKGYQVVNDLKKEVREMDTFLQTNSIEEEDFWDAFNISLAKMFKVNSIMPKKHLKKIFNLIRTAKDPSELEKLEKLPQSASEGKEVKVELQMGTQDTETEETSHPNPYLPQSSIPFHNPQRKIEVGQSAQEKKKEVQTSSKPIEIKPQHKETHTLNELPPSSQSYRPQPQLRDISMESQARTEMAKDFYMPIIFEQLPGYFKDVSSRVTKINNDDYRKLRAEQPLPAYGVHTIKMKMISNGTTAVGIVPESYCKNRMIDDRYVPAVKYISFSNGSGMIKLCGEELKKGWEVFLNEGDVLTVVYDADARVVSFSNGQLKKFEMEIGSRLKGKLFFYLELKTKNTSVKFLQ